CCCFPPLFSIIPGRFPNMKTAARLSLLAVSLAALFYLFLVIPNDRRVETAPFPPPPFDGFHALSHDLTRELPRARIKGPASSAGEELLSAYPYRGQFHRLHRGPHHMQVSLGWFPLKAVQRDCLFAPAPTDLEFAVTLPAHPVLKFDYGIVPSVGRRRCSPVSFTVALEDSGGREHYLFQRTEVPLALSPGPAAGAFYKAFHAWLAPEIEDRGGRWNAVHVGLNDFAGQAVKIRLTTQSAARVSSSAQGAPGLAFWGQPRIYEEQGARQGKNVILVVIGALRADTPPEYAPHLHESSGKGVSFTRAYAGAGTEELSVYSLLASRPAPVIPEAAGGLKARESEGFTPLPLVFREAGWRTAAIGPFTPEGGGRALPGGLGFDEVVALGLPGYGPPHVTSSALEWLSRNGRERFFLMLYYDGPREPYRPPLRCLWRSLRQGNTGDFREALYAGEVMYLDDYIGRLQEYLASTGLVKDTLLVITSARGASRPDGRDASRVPLIFCGLAGPKKIDDPVTILDLAPTIADLAGMQVPGGFMGKSLKRSFEDR
ncbi:MAG: sulfatase-like hydrolase/transferase, partial [Endomicrobiales bacterium]